MAETTEHCDCAQCRDKDRIIAQNSELYEYSGCEKGECRTARTILVTMGTNIDSSAPAHTSELCVTSQGISLANVLTDLGS